MGSVGRCTAGQDSRRVARSLNSGFIVAASDTGIYRTTDQGITWTLESSASAFGGASVLARSATTPATIYLLVGSSIYRSTDNGSTWAFRGSMPACCASEITVDRVDAGTVYAVNAFGATVQRSIDGGASWSTRPRSESG